MHGALDHGKVVRAHVLDYVDELVGGGALGRVVDGLTCAASTSVCEDLVACRSGILRPLMVRDRSRCGYPLPGSCRSTA